MSSSQFRLGSSLASSRRATCLTSLPEDVFLLILSYLEAWDVRRCQFVSQTWSHAFSKELYLHKVLKTYSLPREMKVYKSGCQTEDIFNTIAARYFHLTRGKIRRTNRYHLRALDQSGNWFPVGQWDYHESQPGGRLYYENAASHLRVSVTKPYLFRPTLWSYDDGMVVFCPSNSRTLRFCMLDLQTNSSVEVPFDITSKMVRNIRLSDQTLIIEWAEAQPYHDLNLVEKVHRHFATCFDVSKVEGKVNVALRSEWRIHFLGLPLSNRDNFFSTHNRNHYAWYLWQPNRSLWTGDEDMPIEALFVWDISHRSSYLPSQDPSNKHRPPPETCGPHMVARLSFRELDFIGVRQHASIGLMSLKLHSDAMSITVRENKFESGQGYFDPAERVWRSTVTTFPFVGEGPCWQVRDEENLPPYRGHCSMESAAIDNIEKWFLPIMDVHDSVAEVRFSLIETCFTGAMMENKFIIRTKVFDRWIDLDDRVVQEVGALGRIAGDERWLVGQNSKMELVVAYFQ